MLSLLQLLVAMSLAPVDAAQHSSTDVSAIFAPQTSQLSFLGNLGGICACGPSLLQDFSAKKICSVHRSLFESAAKLGDASGRLITDANKNPLCGMMACIVLPGSGSQLDERFCFFIVESHTWKGIHGKGGDSVLSIPKEAAEELGLRQETLVDWQVVNPSYFHGLIPNPRVLGGSGSLPLRYNVAGPEREFFGFAGQVQPKVKIYDISIPDGVITRITAASKANRKEMEGNRSQTFIRDTAARRYTQ